MSERARRALALLGAGMVGFVVGYQVGRPGWLAVIVVAWAGLALGAWAVGVTIRGDDESEGYGG